MNKIERLSSILVKLQSRRYITAQQIAEQFDISLRTVYRDIRILEESGVPIVANLGLGYSIIEGYKLPPLMFTTDEAIAFLMAEKQLSGQSDTDGYQMFRHGMDKIRAVLKGAEKEIMEDFEENIRIVDTHNSHTRDSSINILQPLLRCIIEYKPCRIEYQAYHTQEKTIRLIEPVGIFFMNNQWYVMAWCTLRNDYRTFKLTRILTIKKEDKTFERSHPKLKVLLKRLYSNETIYNVVLKLQKETLRIIGTSKYFHGLIHEEERGRYVIQEYKTYSLEHFGRWFLSFADKAKIMEPQELKSVVRELIKNIEI